MEQKATVQASDDQEPVPATPTPASPSGRWREWLLRGVFEAALILFGILGALAVNEWQASRERHARTTAIVAAVHAELESNLRLIEDASNYNSEVVANFRKLAAENATTIPPQAYPRGLLIRPQLTTAAWSSMQFGEAVNDMPVATVLLLAAVYDNQRDYLEATANLLNTLYSMALQSNREPAQPGLLGGVLSDYASRGRRLAKRYEEALAHLAGANQPAPRP